MESFKAKMMVFRIFFTLLVGMTRGCSPATQEPVHAILDPEPPVLQATQINYTPLAISTSTPKRLKHEPTSTNLTPTTTPSMFVIAVTATDSTPREQSLETLVPKGENTQIPQPELVLTDCTAAGLPEFACTGVSTNSEWSTLVQKFNGVEMVLVPLGCFMMGSSDGFPKEQPEHQVCLSQPFWIDRTEVTVEQYVRYMNATGATMEDSLVWTNAAGKVYLQVVHENGVWVAAAGDAHRPLEAVPFQKAVDFCSWRGARLLTEAEWEYAARGPDGWLYPWGNDFKPENVVRIYEKTPPVGSKPQGASWVGALDMSSSLHEWVSSIYKPYPYNPKDGREIPFQVDNTSERVLRGGSWYHSDGIRDNVSATARLIIPPWYTTWPFGFRCGLSIDL